jgi:hypothetical protein
VRANVVSAAGPRALLTAVTGGHGTVRAGRTRVQGEGLRHVLSRFPARRSVFVRFPSASRRFRVRSCSRGGRSCSRAGARALVVVVVGRARGLSRVRRSRLLVRARVRCLVAVGVLLVPLQRQLVGEGEGCSPPRPRRDPVGPCSATREGATWAPSSLRPCSCSLAGRVRRVAERLRLRALECVRALRLLVPPVRYRD